jgi:hypothetical protein
MVEAAGTRAKTAAASAPPQCSLQPAGRQIPRDDELPGDGDGFLPDCFLTSPLAWRALFRHNGQGSKPQMFEIGHRETLSAHRTKKPRSKQTMNPKWEM